MFVNRHDLGRKNVIEEAREEARNTVPQRLIEEVGSDGEDEDRGVRRIGEGAVDETTGLLDAENHVRPSEGNIWRQ